MEPPVACLTQLQAPHLGLCRFTAQGYANQSHSALAVPMALTFCSGHALFRCSLQMSCSFLCQCVCLYAFPPVEIPSLFSPAFWNLHVLLKTSFMYFILLQSYSRIYCGHVHNGLGVRQTYTQVWILASLTLPMAELHNQVKSQYPHL